MIWNTIKRLALIFAAVAVALPAYAQVADAPVGLSLDGETTATDSQSSQQVTQPAVPASPIVEPTAIEQGTPASVKKEVEEPKSNLSFSPSLGITPIGVSCKVPYFKLNPGISLSGNVVTSKKNVFSYSIGYNFTFKQQLDDNSDYGIVKNNKQFVHEVTFNLGWDFASKWSTGLFAMIDYKRVSSSQSLGDNDIYSQVAPSISVQAHPKVSLALKMEFGFWQSSFGTVDPVTGRRFVAEPPDPETVRRGGFSYTVAPDSTYVTGLISDPISTPYIGPSSYDDEKSRNFQTALNFSVSADPRPGTGLSSFYRYELPVDDVSSDGTYSGHKWGISISQDLWEGGSGSLSYSIRYRYYPWQFVNNESKWRLRQDISLGINHQVNDYISVNAWYGFARRDSNNIEDENSFNKNETHSASISTTFSW